MKGKILTGLLISLLGPSTLIGCASNNNDKSHVEKHNIELNKLSDLNFLNTLDIKTIKNPIFNSLKLNKNHFSISTDNNYAYNKELSSKDLKAISIKLNNRNIKIKSIREYERDINKISLHDITLYIEEDSGKVITRTFDELHFNGFKENKNMGILNKIELKNIGFDFTGLDLKRFPSEEIKKLKALSSKNTFKKDGIDVQYVIKQQKANDDNGSIDIDVELSAGNEKILKHFSKNSFYSNQEYLNELKQAVIPKINSYIFNVKKNSANNNARIKISDIKASLEEKINFWIQRINKDGKKRDGLKVTIPTDYDSVELGGTIETLGTFSFDLKLGNSKIKINNSKTFFESNQQYAKELYDFLSKDFNRKKVYDFIYYNKKIDTNGAFTTNNIFSKTDLNNFLTSQTVKTNIIAQIELFFSKYFDNKYITLPTYLSDSKKSSLWVKSGSHVNAYIDNPSIDSNGLVKFRLRIKKNDLEWYFPFEINPDFISSLPNTSNIDLTKSDLGNSGVGDYYKFDSTKEKLEEIIFNKITANNSNTYIDAISIDKKIPLDNNYHIVLFKLKQVDGKVLKKSIGVKYTISPSEIFDQIKSIQKINIYKDTIENNKDIFKNALDYNFPGISQYIKSITLASGKSISAPLKSWGKTIKTNIVFVDPTDNNKNITKTIDFYFEKSRGYIEIENIIKALKYIAKKSSGDEKTLRFPMSITSWTDALNIDKAFISSIKLIVDSNGKKIFDQKNIDYNGAIGNTFSQDIDFIEDKNTKKFNITTDKNPKDQTKKHGIRLSISKFYSTNAEHGSVYTKPGLFNVEFK